MIHKEYTKLDIIFDDDDIKCKFQEHLVKILSECQEEERNQPNRIIFVYIAKNQYGHFSSVSCCYYPNSDNDLSGYGSHTLNIDEEWLYNEYINFRRKNKLERILK